jgi:PilZ domain
MNTVRPPTGAIEQSAVITNEPGPGPAVVPVAPQLVPPQKERSVQRRRVLKSATMAFNQRFSSVPCVVHNLSSTGALLRIEGTITVPNTFDVMLDLDGLEAHCQVVWRRDK